MRQRINRIKVVLAEKQRTNKWLAENLGKEYSTISKWCTNTNQPDLVTLTKIAYLLTAHSTALGLRAVSFPLEAATAFSNLFLGFMLKSCQRVIMSVGSPVAACGLSASHCVPVSCAAPRPDSV